MGETIGIIGCGNMGQAICQRLKQSYKIQVFDLDKHKTRLLTDIGVADSLKGLLDSSATLVVAVKPQDFGAVLGQIKYGVSQKLIISIAAGISTKYIEDSLGKVRVVRVMPNLPAKIGRSMSCLCRGSYSGFEDMEFSQKLFSYLGETLVIKEEMMDEATAVSGSGPGFLYYLIINEPMQTWQDFATAEFIPKLSESAQRLGFTLTQAQLLANTTTAGSLALLEVTGLSPKELCQQVTSKGGTTEAGLKSLNGVASLPDATAAALTRAKELSSAA